MRMGQVRGSEDSVKLQPNKGISRLEKGEDRDSYILKLTSKKSNNAL
jgi:hypothetical protein